MGKPVILGACRTAGGKFGGSLKSFKAHELGGIAVAEAVKRSGIDPDQIDDVILGNAWQANGGMNPARIAMMNAGLPVTIPAVSVNQRCGTGLQTVMMLADRIRLGYEKAGVAGGMESCSNVPYLLDRVRWGLRMGEAKVLDALQIDGFICPFTNMLMGETGDILAKEFTISRREQDEYAAHSHQKALKAIIEGVFSEEIVPVILKDKKGEGTAFERDEIPREDSTLENLEKLRPVFRKDGTVTAGNSCALCDAASALVLANEEWAKAQGYIPMAEIISYSSVGLDPLFMGLGPVYAVPKALDAAGLSMEDIDLIELNEAFASQALAVQRKIGFPWEKCNIYGGAIALGHPSGATGAKLLTTAAYALKREDKELGLVTLCVGGGQGVAMVIRRV